MNEILTHARINDLLTHPELITRDEVIAALLCARGKQAISAAGTRAALDVLAERQRQVSVEGFHPAGDDANNMGELVAAAVCYAENAGRAEKVTLYWPWGAEWYKPTTARRDLVKSVALLIAEIERLDRQEARPCMTS
ncbi:hypothetical protein ABN36_18295 [Salmonella enterica subsp. enterica]|nr:hypothetical protein [Salmonella enterica subsp. enterica]EGI6509430.1 hypothetical protein [Salmonella enterica subsp. enterica serovar Durham]